MLIYWFIFPLRCDTIFCIFSVFCLHSVTASSAVSLSSPSSPLSCLFHLLLSTTFLFFKRLSTFLPTPSSSCLSRSCFKVKGMWLSWWRNKCLLLIGGAAFNYRNSGREIAKRSCDAVLSGVNSPQSSTTGGNRRRTTSDLSKQSCLYFWIKAALKGPYNNLLELSPRISIMQMPESDACCW